MAAGKKRRIATPVSRRQAHFDTPNISTPAPVPESQHIYLTSYSGQTSLQTPYAPPVTETSQIFPGTQQSRLTTQPHQTLPVEDTPDISHLFPLKHLFPEQPPPPEQPSSPRQLPETLLSLFTELEITVDDKPIMLPRRKRQRTTPMRGYFDFYKKEKKTIPRITFSSKIKSEHKELPSNDIPSAESCKYMVKGADYYYNIVMFMLSNDEKLGEIIRECKEQDEARIKGICA